MKKLLILSMALVMVLLAMTACSKSIEDYETLLDEAGYDVDYAKNSQIEDLLELFDLDEDDFPVKKAFKANKKTKNVIVIEFDSSSTAEDFVDEADDLEDYFDDAKVEIKGACVLIGSSTSAINDALGK